MFGWISRARADFARIMAVVDRLEAAVAPRASDQERSCAAADIVYPVIRDGLGPNASDEQIVDLNVKVIAALIQNRML